MTKIYNAEQQFIRDARIYYYASEITDKSSILKNCLNQFVDKPGIDPKEDVGEVLLRKDGFNTKIKDEEQRGLIAFSYCRTVNKGTNMTKQNKVYAVMQQRKNPTLSPSTKRCCS